MAVFVPTGLHTGTAQARVLLGTPGLPAGLTARWWRRPDGGWWGFQRGALSGPPALGTRSRVRQRYLIPSDPTDPHTVTGLLGVFPVLGPGGPGVRAGGGCAPRRARHQCDQDKTAHRSPSAVQDKRGARGFALILRSGPYILSWITSASLAKDYTQCGVEGAPQQLRPRPLRDPGLSTTCTLMHASPWQAPTSCIMMHP